jgi:hypothetical protein
LKSKQLYKIVQTNKTNEQSSSKPKQKPTTNWTKPANNQTNQQQLNLSVTPKISSYQHYSKMWKLVATKPIKKIVCPNYISWLLDLV